MTVKLLFFLSAWLTNVMRASVLTIFDLFFGKERRGPAFLLALVAPTLKELANKCPLQIHSYVFCD